MPALLAEQSPATPWLGWVTRSHLALPLSQEDLQSWTGSVEWLTRGNLTLSQSQPAAANTCRIRATAPHSSGSLAPGSLAGATASPRARAALEDAAMALLVPLVLLCLGGAMCPGRGAPVPSQEEVLQSVWALLASGEGSLPHAALDSLLSIVAARVQCPAVPCEKVRLQPGAVCSPPSSAGWEQRLGQTPARAGGAEAAGMAGSQPGRRGQAAAPASGGVPRLGVGDAGVPRNGEMLREGRAGMAPAGGASP